MIVDFIRRRCRDKVPNIVIDKSILIAKSINEARHDSGAKKYIIIRGINRTSLIAATVLYASYMTTYPLNASEAASLFQITNKILTKGEKLFYRMCSSDIKHNLVKAEKDCVRNFCIRYLVSINKNDDDVHAKVMDIVKNLNMIEQTLLTGHASLRAVVCINFALEYLDLQTPDTRLAIIRETSYTDAIIKKAIKNAHKYRDILVHDDKALLWVQTSNAIRARIKRDTITHIFI